MANAQTLITISHDKDLANDLRVKYMTQIASAEIEAAMLENLFAAFGVGARNGLIVVDMNNGDQGTASGTITLSGVNTVGDTVLLNGVTLTAVASGATGAQFNVGATATIQAANLVLGINGCAIPLVSGTVVASSITGIVTLTASISGQVGNAITTAKGVDAGSVMTVSGARLAGGSAPTASNPLTYRFGV